MFYGRSGAYGVNESLIAYSSAGRTRALDQAAESAVELVDALIPLEIQKRKLLDDAVLLVGGHIFEIVHPLLDVPQTAVDVGKPCHDFSDLPLHFIDDVPLFLIDLIGRKRQPIRR